MQIFLLNIMSEPSQSLLFTYFCIFIHTFFSFWPSLKHKCCLRREAVLCGIIGHRPLRGRCSKGGAEQEEKEEEEEEKEKEKEKEENFLNALSDDSLLGLDLKNFQRSFKWSLIFCIFIETEPVKGIKNRHVRFFFFGHCWFDEFMS